MRIGVDARHLVRDTGGGAAYLRSILRHIPPDYAHDVVLFVDGVPGEHALEGLQCCDVVSRQIAGTSRRVGANFAAPLWLHAVLPGLLREYRIDVFWTPSGYLPRGSNLPGVATIQDLAPFHPDYSSSGLLWSLYFRLETVHTIKKAARFLVPSEATRSDIARWFPEATGKTTVIPLAVDWPPPTPPAPGPWASALAPGVTVLLCVGAYQPRRNVRVVVEALSLLPPGLRGQLRLVLCGGPGSEDRRCEQRALMLGVQELILSLGWASDSELAALYGRADIVVVPSVCEGFGLPVLEAMTCGVPVIASNTSSLPEVVGDAGLLLDPHDPSQWAAAIQRLVGDSSLRQRLATAGLSRVRQFSWERTAAETLRVIEETAALE